MKNKEVKINLFLLLFFTFFSLFSAVAQDSILTKATNVEEKNLAFQEHFFKALSQKSIKHYQKAIDNLDHCNTIIPNNKAVLFELSKNYNFLNKSFEAIEFANKALVIDVENQFVLKHLVAVYKKDRNFTKAIETQIKLIKNNPKEKQNLVVLYFQNKDYTSTKRVLRELEKAKMLTSRLKRLKVKLAYINVLSDKKPKKKKTINSNLFIRFEKEKTFSILEKILKKLEKGNPSELLKYSTKGLDLFPAQPMVYLMKGKALNTLKKYKNALEVLLNGIDFVIDNKKNTTNFFKEIGKSYQGLGNKKEADKYFNKAKQ